LCGSAVQVPDDPPEAEARCAACGALLDAYAGEPPGPVPPRRPVEGPYREGRAPRRGRAEPDRDDVEDEDDSWEERRWRRRPYSRSSALSKVTGPGTLLQVYGGLLCLGAVLLCLTGGVVAFAEDVKDRGPLALVCGIGAVACLVVGPIILAGGTRMKALRSYGLALTSVILVFLIGLLTCVPAVVIGVWPLVVLLDGNVKAAFEESTEGEGLRR
jgi:hypothetical protein